MACSSQPGPARAIRFIEEHTEGIKLTQRDWHTLRDFAAGEAGRRLSKAAASESRKVNAARSLAVSLRASQVTGNDFVYEFMIENNTDGTCDVLEYVAHSGIPDEVKKVTRRNRARQVDKGMGTTSLDGQKFPVIRQDSQPTVVNLNGVQEKVFLFRIMFRGEIIGVTLTKEMAEKIASKFVRKQETSSLEEL